MKTGGKLIRSGDSVSFLGLMTLFACPLDGGLSPFFAVTFLAGFFGGALGFLYFSVDALATVFLGLVGTRVFFEIAIFHVALSSRRQTFRVKWTRNSPRNFKFS